VKTEKVWCTAALTILLTPVPAVSNILAV